YVGDFDSSGLHMSEVDLPRRLAEYGAPGDPEFRIALTREDATDDLSSFSIDNKRGDPRWACFRDCYGDRCWQIDALNPVALRERVEAAIVERLDLPTWTQYGEAERVERESIGGAVSAWCSLGERSATGKVER